MPESPSLCIESSHVPQPGERYRLRIKLYAGKPGWSPIASYPDWKDAEVEVIEDHGWGVEVRKSDSPHTAIVSRENLDHLGQEENVCDGDFAGPAACRCGHPERHVEITDEMVERGASALALHEDYDPNMVPSQLWPAITRKYQERARVVLSAALGEMDQQQGGSEA